jgi:hypothetical protein
MDHNLMLDDDLLNNHIYLHQHDEEFELMHHD